jgi:hypothetical protein
LVSAESVRRSGFPLLSFLFTNLAAVAGSIHWLPRPHVFTFVMLAVWVGWLERLREEKASFFWRFPMLMLIWVNLHGGFIFGFMAWAAYAIGWVWDRWQAPESASAKAGRQLLLVGGLSGLASVVTPSGWGNWQAVLGNSSPYILSRTVETMSPDFHQPFTWIFLILLGFSIALPSLSGNRLPAAQSFLLAGFAVLGLLVTRNIPLFCIVAAPILTVSMRRMLKRGQAWLRIEFRLSEIESSLHGSFWMAAGALGTILLFALHYANTRVAVNQFDVETFPVAAADWLAVHPQQGNMFNEFNWGGYLLYRLWPGQRVFIDSQTDFYGEALVRDYEGILNAREDWDEQLKKYDANWVIVRVDSQLGQVLAQNSDWERSYQDELAVIFRRTR